MKNILHFLTNVFYNLVLFVTVLCLCGCENVMFLTAKDTFNLHIEQKEIEGNKIITISGLCGHSAWGVDKIEKKERKHCLFLRISLKPKKRGDFKFDIPIENNIEKIYWEKDLIWERKK
jgi:hypothetical protein